MAETNPTGSAIEVRRPLSAQTTPQKKAREVHYRPPMDIYEFDDRYELRLDLPGSAPDAIEATVSGAVLTVHARVRRRYGADITPVHAEYGVGDFRRQVRLGEDIDTDRLAARYADGVLTLALPKLAQRRPRRIPISGG